MMKAFLGSFLVAFFAIAIYVSFPLRHAAPPPKKEIATFTGSQMPQESGYWSFIDTGDILRVMDSKGVEKLTCDMKKKWCRFGPRRKSYLASPLQQ